MFPTKICKIFKNIYFEEYMWTTVSMIYRDTVLSSYIFLHMQLLKVAAAHEMGRK